MMTQLRSQGDWVKQWRWGRVETVGDSGFLKGQVTFFNGETKGIDLTLSHIDDIWLIDGIEWLDKR